MWGSCDRLPTNGCVNVTLLYTNTRGYSDSLQMMCDKLIGKDSFRKDRNTTCSDWDAPVLSLRQLVYAALDAQTSHYLGARVPVLPRLMHLSDLQTTWLDRASHWMFLRRVEGKEQEKELEVAFESVNFGQETVKVRMQQYSTRIRNRSNVTFYWKARRPP
jgi:ribonuclease D